MTDTPETTIPEPAEAPAEAPPAASSLLWIGRKPPEPATCNKPSGICGYLNCKPEGRCLHVVKQPAKK